MMDTVTYPDPDVRRELQHWIERKVDVTETRTVAEVFGVTAVPVAIGVTGDGRILGRIANFVEPARFLESVKEMWLGN